MAVEDNESITFDQDQEDLDRLLDSDDPEELAKLFDSEPTGQAEPEPKADPEPEPDPEPEGKEPKSEPKEPDPDPDPDPEPQPKGQQDDKGKDPEPDPDPEPQGVLMKDGKTVAPYSLLEKTRAERAQYLQELSEAREELNKLKGRSQSLEDVLKRNNIDAAHLEQGQDLTDEQIDAIAEESPVIAQAIRTLQARVAASTPAHQQEAPVPKTVTPVDLAIRDNPDLHQWRQSDKDRYEMAQYFDSKLMNDPAWSSKSLDERFAEAARLTKLEFNDPLEPTPQSQNREQGKPNADTDKRLDETLKQAQRKASPSSLSDLGQQAESEKSVKEQLAELPDHELEERMAKMSPEQLDQFFADGF